MWECKPTVASYSYFSREAIFMWTLLTFQCWQILFKKTMQAKQKATVGQMILWPIRLAASFRTRGMPYSLLYSYRSALYPAQTLNAGRGAKDWGGGEESGGAFVQLVLIVVFVQFTPSYYVNIYTLIFWKILTGLSRWWDFSPLCFLLYAFLYWDEFNIT